MPLDRATNRNSSIALRSLKATSDGQSFGEPKETSLPITEVLFKIRHRMTHLRSSHRKDLRAELVEVYQAARILKDEQAAWAHFCKEPDWTNFRGKPKHEDRADALRYALRFAVGFAGPQATKRASKYYAALQPFFQQDVAASQLAGLIKQGGGIEALARAKAKKSSRPTPPKIDFLILKLPRDDRAKRIGALEVGAIRTLKFVVRKSNGDVLHLEALMLIRGQPKSSYL